MLDRVKLGILRYMKENYDDLLALDLSVARLMGAPAPHTISSYTHQLAKAGNPVACVAGVFIDATFHWLLEQPDHCKSEYESVTGQNS